MELTQVQIEQARSKGKTGQLVICPGCKKLMQTLKITQGDHGMPELYCDPCHLSIPLKD